MHPEGVYLLCYIGCNCPYRVHEEAEDHYSGHPEHKQTIRGYSCKQQFHNIWKVSLNSTKGIDSDPWIDEYGNKEDEVKLFLSTENSLWLVDSPPLIVQELSSNIKSINNNINKCDKYNKRQDSTKDRKSNDSNNIIWIRIYVLWFLELLDCLLKHVAYLSLKRCDLLLLI